MRISDWSSDVCSSDLIFVGFLRGHFQRADDVAADLRIGVAHLFHEARRADPQLVGQEDGARLVAHDLARAPDGMAKAKRFLLADIDGRSGLLPDALARLPQLSAPLPLPF